MICNVVIKKGETELIAKYEKNTFESKITFSFVLASGNFYIMRKTCSKSCKEKEKNCDERGRCYY